jgi:DNA polymerase III subunit delta'
VKLGAVRGQAKAIAILERALAGGRLGSAYLFEGPSGVGKELAAVGLAAEAIAGGDDSVRDRVLARNHPDLRVFGPREEGKGNIKVDFVRSEILPFTQFAPFEAQEAFVIFPDADVSFPESQPESANALLKTLEEPRRGVRFILLSSRPDRLIPTIRSRSQRIRFDRLESEVLASILEAASIPEEDRGAAIALAYGRADRAIDLATEGRARDLLDRAMAIDDAAIERKPGALLARAEELAADDDKRLALETLATYYHDLACLGAGARDELLMFEHAKRALGPRAERRPVASFVRAEELVQETVLALEGQANPQIALDALLYGLAGLPSSR